MHQSTVNALFGSAVVNAAMLDAANAEFHESLPLVRKRAWYDDPVFGVNMCFQTVLCLAEQMFRRGVYADILGELLTGAFGRTCTTMQVSALGKSRPRKSTTGKAYKRKKHGCHGGTTKEARSLWQYTELIQETAWCTLFGACDGLRLLVPMAIGTDSHKGSTRYKVDSTGKAVKVDGVRIHAAEDVFTNWLDYKCLDTVSGKLVRLASQFSPEERQHMQSLIEHNSGCTDPSRYTYLSLNTVRADRLCKLFDDKRLLIVRGIGDAMSHNATNCVMTAFRSSAARIIPMEFGKTVEIPTNLEEHKKGKMARHTEQMLPVLYKDAIRVRCNPLQIAILEANLETQSAEDCLALVNCRLHKPICRATFFNHLKVLKQIAEEVSAQDNT